MTRPRALVLYARSVPAGLHRSIADTVVARLGVISPRLRQALVRNRYARFWLEDYSSLSYVSDWLDAFRSTPRLDVDLCNLNDLIDFPRQLRRIADYDLTIVLHSAAGDNLHPLLRAASGLQRRSGPLVVFFGNEYNLMPDKIGFARDVGAEFIASQLPIDSAMWLYAGCPAAVVVPAPPGLNPAVFAPASGERPVDIGFRGALYAHPFALGDEERTALLRFFQEQAQSFGLVSDIQFVRHSGPDWSAFLNRCKGTIGAESGTHYLERDDSTRDQVIDYVQQHPDADFAEVAQRFFANYAEPISGKAISSRHFEAMGTRTCQILLEGSYNGILRPDVHYICLRKDYSNLEDVVRRFRDADYRLGMVDRAHDYALTEHTYAHRVDRVLDEMLGQQDVHQPGRS